MKILAVCGSRRTEGNTSSIIRETLEPFREKGFQTEVIYPGQLDISGCRGCEGCAKSGRCVINDDMQEIYDKIRRADALIAGTPTYFFNLTSDMKKFIDRCYCFFKFDKTDRSVWSSRLTESGPRIAGIISVCEQDNADDMGYTPAAMKSAFESLGYRIVFNHRVLHVFKAGEIINRPEQLQQARENGIKLLKTLRLQE